MLDAFPYCEIILLIKICLFHFNSHQLSLSLTMAAFQSASLMRKESGFEGNFIAFRCTGFWVLVNAYKRYGLKTGPVYPSVPGKAPTWNTFFTWASILHRLPKDFRWLATSEVGGINQPSSSPSAGCQRCSQLCHLCLSHTPQSWCFYCTTSSPGPHLSKVSTSLCPTPHEEC